MDNNETRRLDDAAKAAGLAGVSAIQLKLFLNSANAPAQPAPERSQNPPETASQKEARYRRWIEDFCRSCDRNSGNPWGTMNGAIVARFKKGRADMTLKELEAVWDWLQRDYGARQQPDAAE